MIKIEHLISEFMIEWPQSWKPLGEYGSSVRTLTGRVMDVHGALRTHHVMRRANGLA